jgi:two-component system OmpR family sensor kinase
MSLATRITLLVAALLGACGLIAGAAFHGAVKRSLDAELQGRLEARLAWLAGALDVELEDGELQLDARDEPAGAEAAAHWHIATADGRVLWASAGAAPAEPISRTRAVSFGRPDAPALTAAQVVAGDGSRDEAPGGGRVGWAAIPLSGLPATALDGARRVVPGIEPKTAFRKTRVKKRASAGDPTFELHGTAGGREYAMRLDAAGNVLRIKDSAVDPFAEYELPPDAGRLELVLTAQASGAEARGELSRLTRTLWTVGPLALAATALVLAMLIRRQLRPLARMSEQASSIGPTTAASGIAPADSSLELVRLRQAINSMLARLAEGLDRERRFSATAAHELRTPLAQMRATVEVALRRPREAPEYREALEHVSADVQRLQKLVVGLLQLTRGAEAARSRGAAIPLRPLLRGAMKRCGPAELPGDSGQDGDAHGPWVYGDIEMLHAAVWNVLENAARYAPGEPPTVRVEAEEGGDRDVVRVVIADRGPGVADKDRERIFEPLTRLDDARTVDGVDGFGLGLAVARTIARAFGGDLVCRGRGDGARGAEFVFTLHRAAPADDPVGAAAPAVATPADNLLH